MVLLMYCSNLLVKLTLFLLLLLPFTGCEKAEPVFNSRFLAFGTLTDISILGVSHERALAASQALEEDFVTMHEAWHAWNPGPLGRTNELLKQGQPFSAPPSVLGLLVKSKQLANDSEHLFNPAIGRLINLWGFHSDNPECKQPPQDESIKLLVGENPNMNDIRIDGFHLQSSNPVVKLDFGAIGKGHGIDMAVEHLKELGIKNAIVNSGGDLRAIGSRSGHPWRIAIRSPSGSGTFGFLHIKGDESVFTSGNYERNYVCEGQTYHHIIDPRTGYPAKGTSSVTVIHSDASTADAAATALFVAGPSDWHRIARKMGIRYVLLIDTNGIAHMNPAMRQRVALMDQHQPVKTHPPLVTGNR